ncbi:MAG TPA: chlorite dismutase family protein [Thermoanaerobaculia bacterium]|nr:chlorite dismutase family protein [Thermoanaerobaculia bacterium]
MLARGVTNLSDAYSGRLFTFAGGRDGLWRVVLNRPVSGEPLASVDRLAVLMGDARVEARWLLRGVTSYERYVTADEKRSLLAAQPPIGRPEATCAALIPIRKSAEWWQLPQDARRAVLEESSHHIATGLKYLPAIARRLHHGHDLGEPFDFLTWFEFAPRDRNAFEDLVGALRATEEWQYVEREVDLRLERG